MNTLMNNNSTFMKLNDIQKVINSEWAKTGKDSKQLVERGNKKNSSSTPINACEQEYLLYKFEDSRGRMKMPYLSNERDVQKICDYVIFTQKSDTLYVLLFELKDGGSGSKKQLDATQILSEYLLKTTSRVFECSDKNIKYRKITITGKSIKRNLRPRKIYDDDDYTQLPSERAINIRSLCK